MNNIQLINQLRKEELTVNLRLLAGGGLGDGQPRGYLMSVRKQPGKHFVSKTHWVKFGLSYWTVSVDGIVHDEFTDELQADTVVASLNSKLGV